MQTIFFILFIIFTYSIVGQIELPQSHIVISDIVYYFQPAQVIEWLNDMFVSSLEECIRQCNQDFICRTFDYNVEPNWCRLFGVEPSPGQILYDSSVASQVGYVQLFSDLYSAFNQTCDNCIEERYLICVDNTCQCPWNTFWDGSICQKQKYAGDFCTNNNECWTYIYNLTCALANVCTSAGYSTNLCALNQNLVLLNFTTNANQPYIFYSFDITAITTSITITFTFSITNKHAFWLLDNISLIKVNTSTQLIKNGDFETGNLIYWNYCNPYFSSVSSIIVQNGSYPSQSGQYFYYGGPYRYPDFLSQTISTTIGNLYKFSFWLGNTAVGSNYSRFIATIFF